MWKGTGRSGYGEQSILGEYDSWVGLSMNGRQYKNRHTKEVRDLTGADYWHQRKALEPKIPEDIPTFVNGRPNIAAFADKEQKPKAKKKRSIVERVSLADSHYNRLEDLSLELDKEMESGSVSFEDYAYLRRVMDERLEKAWQRLSKARGFIDEEPEGESHNSYRQNVDFDSKNYGKQSVLKGVSIDYSGVDMPAVFDSLKDDNFFKQICFRVLTTKQAIAKILLTNTNKG